MAAGKGTRLGDLAAGDPKSYLEINSESLIERQVRLMREIGVDEIVIVTGYKKERFEKDFSAPDVTFAFNPFYDFANVLSSYWCAKHLLKDDLVYMHADTIYSRKILNDLMSKSGDIVLPVDYKSCGEEEMKVKTRDGLVYEINKTMPPEEAEGEFIGLAKISRNTLPYLNASSERLMANKDFNAFIEMSFQELIDRNEAKLTAFSINGEPWNEIDFEEDYQEAVRLFLK